MFFYFVRVCVVCGYLFVFEIVGYWGSGYGFLYVFLWVCVKREFCVIKFRCSFIVLFLSFFDVCVFLRIKVLE